jgi:hypothetical protein
VEKGESGAQCLSDGTCATGEPIVFDDYCYCGNGPTTHFNTCYAEADGLFHVTCNGTPISPHGGQGGTEFCSGPINITIPEGQPTTTMILCDGACYAAPHVFQPGECADINIQGGVCPEE